MKVGGTLLPAAPRVISTLFGRGIGCRPERRDESRHGRHERETTLRAVSSASNLCARKQTGEIFSKRRKFNSFPRVLQHVVTECPRHVGRAQVAGAASGVQRLRLKRAPRQSLAGDENPHRPDTIRPQDVIVPHMLLRVCWLVLVSIAILSAQETPPKPPLGLPPVPWPADNPYSAARVELGRYLFFDPRLSVNATVACATCHPPQHAFAGGDPAPLGVTRKTLPRRAPTLINRAYGKVEFYDGRALTLEDQIAGPVTNPDEMGTTKDAVAEAVSKIPGYAPSSSAHSEIPKSRSTGRRKRSRHSSARFSPATRPTTAT